MKTMQDEKVIVSIYEKYYDDVKRYFTSYTHDVMQAEDLTQDLFVKVMGLDIICESTAKSLLFVTARRMMVDEARHKAFVRRSVEQMYYRKSELSENPMSRIIALDITNVISSKLDRMPMRQAAVYRMARFDDMSALEISKKLGLSQRTVESHIYNANREVKAFIHAV